MQISDFIMSLMKKKTSGISFCDPRGQHTVSRIMDGFVDDTTIWANSFIDSLTTDKTVEIAEDLKSSAQWWEELLTATGGKLELPKCFFYLIKWAFNDFGNPSPADVHHPIGILDHTTGENVTITQQDGFIPHKTLGAYLAPDSNHVEKILAETKRQQEIQAAARKAGNPTEEVKTHKTGQEVYRSKSNKFK